MRTIKIDDDVWEILKKAAVPFEDEPNDAVRRLLGLPDKNPGRPSPPRAGGTNGGGGGTNGGAFPQGGGGPRFDRSKIEETIVQIVKERGGQALIKDHISGFNMYDEVADRLGISRQARMELTAKGENRWRAEVGFARKNLEQRGVIAPTSESGRGLWKLK